MDYIFSSDIIKGKKYKKIVHYLCDVADKIYFTFYEDLMLNNKILELEQKCKIISVPKKIREQFDTDIIGYEVNIFITMYIFEYNSLYDLLRDRVYGAVLFYSGNSEIVYIQLEDFNDIYIQTNDKNLIKEFSNIESHSN
jgi:hypothetical protein